ncbi:hypothetical protein Tco_0285778 [Tanacetum coccineum]
MPSADSYSAADVTTLNTCRTLIQKQPEALLCLVGLSRNYFLGDGVYLTFLYDDDWGGYGLVQLDQYGRHDRDVRILRDTFRPREILAGFCQRKPTPLITKKDGTEEQVQDGLSSEIPPVENPTVTEVIPEPDLEKEVAAIGPLVNKSRRKRGNDEADANAPPKVLRKGHAVSCPIKSTLGGKSLASIGLEAGSTFFAPASLKTLADSSSKAATEIPTRHIATTEVQGQIFAESPESGKSASFSSASGSPKGIFQLEWGVINNCCLDTPDACQDMVDHIVPLGYFSKLRHLSNTDFLSQHNVNMSRQVAIGSQLRLRFEQEVRLLKKATAKIAKRDQRIKAREEEIERLAQELKSLRTIDTELQGLRNQTRNLETLLAMSHPAKAEARGVTSWISLQHNGVYYRDTKRKRK